ncbi:phosphoribosylformylglycinamidine synthase subunit PurQ [soil metagenome]
MRIEVDLKIGKYKSMAKPKTIIFSGYGLNSEEETKYAFELAGAKADIIHINDVIDGRYRLADYQIAAFPGGFAYGDDTGSGNAYANKLRNNIWEELLTFLNRDTLLFGACNGFQIMANLGLFPVRKEEYGVREIALMHNESARYSDRWVDLQVVNTTSPWLKNITRFPACVSHGEGKFYANEKVLSLIVKKQMVALTYIAGEICAYQNLPTNPNGAVNDIAGIVSQNGRILGLMPHPERSMFFTNLPHWPYLKEKLLREGKILPTYAPALQIFKNAVEYYK